jgi:hypothetical protein
MTIAAPGDNTEVVGEGILDTACKGLYLYLARQQAAIILNI